MDAKKAKKERDKEALSRVKKEMAEPRVANSARGHLGMPIRRAVNATLNL
jgi:hypothetical protein